MLRDIKLSQHYLKEDFSVLDSLFENVGAKIKKYAQYSFWVESIISCIYGLYLLADMGFSDEDSLFIFLGFFIAIPLAALIMIVSK